MMTEEAERARAYHELRCQQERQRVHEARCDLSRRAHIRLFQLHRSMMVNPTDDLPAPTSAMAVE